MGNDLFGRVSDIQRCCVSDGPGIRTTVFLQGCPLHCPWCHNPEFRPFSPLHMFHAEKCIACGRCRKPSGGFACVRDPEKKCSGCGLCEAECPAGALSVFGKTVSVSEVMTTIKRDAFYYQETGGGLTLSGGEPLAQPDFAEALLAAAKREGFSTAVETSGAVSNQIILRIAEQCDWFLFDIKTIPEKYPALIGVEWETVYQNLLTLTKVGAHIRLRTPVVPGFNTDEALPELLHTLMSLPGIQGVDLLPWHSMGCGKATMSGLPEPDWTHMSKPSEALLKRWNAICTKRE